MREKEFLIREAEEVSVEDAYFQARPNLDTPENRRVFAAGFLRGWDKGQESKHTGVVISTGIPE